MEFGRFFILTLLILGYIVGPSLSAVPTVSPTFVPFGPDYCHAFSGINSTAFNVLSDCSSCVQMGCAYCEVDDDSPTRNYCFSYGTPDDPLYGRCDKDNTRSADYHETGEVLDYDTAEEYCYAGIEIPVGILILLLFLYLLIPCVCIAVIVNIIVRVFRGSIFKYNSTIVPGDEYDESNNRPYFRGGGRTLNAPQRYMMPQENIQMAQAHFVQPQPSGGPPPPYQPNHDVESMDAESHITVVYAEALPR